MVTNRRGVSTGCETALSFVRQWIGETVSVPLLQTLPPAAQQPQNKDTRLTECYINSHVWAIVFPQFQRQENGHVKHPWFTSRTDSDKNQGDLVSQTGLCKISSIMQIDQMGLFLFNHNPLLWGSDLHKTKLFLQPSAAQLHPTPHNTRALAYSQSKHHTRPPFPNSLNSSNKCYTLCSRICSCTDRCLYNWQLSLHMHSTGVLVGRSFSRVTVMCFKLHFNTSQLCCNIQAWDLQLREE